MTNLKAVLVDEERLARVNLRKLLAPFSEIEIAGEADSCQSAFELISSNKPGLLFLDIQLSGETGFDLLELIDRSIKVIFVTAYDEDCICHINANSFEYLSKPVNPERLREAIERVKTGEIKLEREPENVCLIA